MRTTKLIRGLSGLSYEKRLHALQLPTWRYRQLRGDMNMNQLYKYVNNKYDTNYARKQNASRVFAIVWASVCLSVRLSCLLYTSDAADE